MVLKNIIRFLALQMVEILYQKKIYMYFDMFIRPIYEYGYINWFNVAIFVVWVIL